HPTHIALVPHAVADEFRDCEHLEPVTLAEFDEVGNATHRAVVVHDLADHTSRCKPRQTRQIDRSLRLTGTDKDATLFRAQGKRMSGTHKITRARLRIDEDLDRARTVVG